MRPLPFCTHWCAGNFGPLIQRLFSSIRGDALRARAMRGTMMTIVSYGGSQALRLGSNLVLTRLLFPEVFGLMALVQVVVAGLQMFSDFGLRASVMQSARGDDPGYLKTAWTLKVLRGGLLWLGAIALAIPAAAIYDEPLMASILPVVGFSAVITGFGSIGILTASRHLELVRLTWLELGSQTIGIVVMIILALLLESVWSLVFGTLVGAAAKTILSHIVLPGQPARFGFERDAFWELFHFGKWIFLGTVAGFLIQHGDRAILGKYITLSELALYTIAFFLATVPDKLHQHLVGKVLFPIYVHKKPSKSAANRAKTLRARALLLAGTFGLSLPFIFFGALLVELLYDPRYHSAGPILVMICLARLFSLLTTSYSTSLLALGEARSFTSFVTCSASVQTGITLLGAMFFGIPGVVFGILISQVITYPLLAVLVRRQGVWGGRQDVGFVLLGFLIAGVLWWQQPQTFAEFFAMVPAAN